MEQGWKKLWEGIEARIVEEVAPKKKFIGIVKKMGKIVTDDKVLYGFLFTAPNFIQESQKRSWKTYQERLYSILQSIIEEGIKKKEFVDLDPGLLMKAIGGIFHQLLISNNEEYQKESDNAMTKAIDHIYKLPPRISYGVKIINYLIHKGDEDKAQKVVKMWIKQFPESLAPLNRLAHLYQRNNRRSEAINTY